MSAKAALGQDNAAGASAQKESSPKNFQELQQMFDKRLDKMQSEQSELQSKMQSELQKVQTGQEEMLAAMLAEIRRERC
jgi:ATP-dependent Clp protease ATP-binding subunit ClpA